MAAPFKPLRGGRQDHHRGQTNGTRPAAGSKWPVGVRFVVLPCAFCGGSAAAPAAFFCGPRLPIATDGCNGRENSKYLVSTYKTHAKTVFKVIYK